MIVRIKRARIMALLLYLYTCIQGRYRPEVMGLFVQSLVGIQMAT